MAYAAYRWSRRTPASGARNKIRSPRRSMSGARWSRNRVAVRYAWARSPMGNLKVNGKPWLPLQSFRTDAWDWPESEDPAQEALGRSQIEREGAGRRRALRAPQNGGSQTGGRNPETSRDAGKEPAAAQVKENPHGEARSNSNGAHRTCRRSARVTVVRACACRLVGSGPSRV